MTRKERFDIWWEFIATPEQRALVLFGFTLCTVLIPMGLLIWLFLWLGSPYLDWFEVIMGTLAAVFPPLGMWMQWRSRRRP